MTTEGNPSRPHLRPAVKLPGSPNDRKVKLTLYLPADLARRFRTHAEMMDRGKSELFAGLVHAPCRRFVAHD